MTNRRTRLRTCDTCHKSEQIRNDVKATTCKQCWLKPKLKKCKMCEALFPVNKKVLYCSSECKEKDTIKKIILNCEVCKKDYKIHPYRSKTSRYCGKECWSRRAHKICKNCGKEFGTVGHYGKDFCSRSCRDVALVGDKAPAWKDGKSLERERARLSGPLVRWKKAVKERDGNKCTKCGSDQYLHAHHIKSFSEFPELTTDVSNGVTLCEFCHSVVHGRWVGAKSRNQRWLQFIEKQTP